jgi:hypothetical protein
MRRATKTVNTWFFCVLFPYCLRLTNKIEWEQRLKAKPTEGNLKPETQGRERPHSRGEQNRGRKKRYEGRKNVKINRKSHDLENEGKRRNEQNWVCAASLRRSCVCM